MSVPPVLFILLLAAALAGCRMPRSEKVTPAHLRPHRVTVTWTANREAAVNSAGGGYKVYYGTTSSFSVPNGTGVVVPYISGATAPTSTNLELTSGTYYVKVAAFSTMNSLSAPSSAVEVVVP